MFKKAKDFQKRLIKLINEMIATENEGIINVGCRLRNYLFDMQECVSDLERAYVAEPEKKVEVYNGICPDCGSQETWFDRSINTDLETGEDSGPYTRCCKCGRILDA